MSRTAWKRAGVSLTALAVTVGVAGCGSETGNSERSVSQVLTAAYKNTAKAKSAKVKMTVVTPSGMADSGTMEISGLMGWDPTVMDMTVSGAALQADPEMPKEIRMMWQNNIMYMDMGTKTAKELGGKRWMKIDLGAAAKLAGDSALQKQMTGGLESMDQDPADQLALLLSSPNVKQVGKEKIDGAETRHYKGTLTVDEVIAADSKALKVLDEAQKKALIATIKKQGIKGYDIETWVNEDDYPVKTDVTLQTPEGKIEMNGTYSDYGSKATVTPPPAAETTDLMKMLKELSAGLESAKKA
ncbi:hypothetical protein [Streptomyces sp. NPDC020965]|uniref:hypothetical protein n=1 Tax=Streptomyces sp. NPDC020965 TaxID=3365105 RepID=UPI0037998666